MTEETTVAPPEYDPIAKAYNAGYALPLVQWPEDATDEQRTPGVHHCPFADNQPEEKVAWLEGLRNALAAPTKDPAAILEEIDVALTEVKS